jgi:DMSO/TMAO reductase YedYZ molybdopterin-dependent catalytic subunit
MKRRLFVSIGGVTLLAGCARISNAVNDNGVVHSIIGAAQPLDHALIGTHGRVRTYRESDIDADFRIDSLDTPSDSHYRDLVKTGYAGYRLVVDGAVEAKQVFSLAELRALQTYSEITRHDCVEGWSAIGKWAGVPLATVLAMAKPLQTARYVVFHCSDRDSDGQPYYESLDLHEAAHPQTVLALALNDRPLEPDHGAPVRLRVPTQLGYKSAKWVYRMELIDSFRAVHGGNGGYWEDQGYEWYAGI